MSYKISMLADLNLLFSYIEMAPAVFFINDVYILFFDNGLFLETFFSTVVASSPKVGDFLWLFYLFWLLGDGEIIDYCIEFVIRERFWLITDSLLPFCGLLPRVSLDFLAYLNLGVFWNDDSGGWSRDRDLVGVLDLLTPFRFLMVK